MNLNSTRRLDALDGSVKTCIACNQRPAVGTLHIVVPVDENTQVHYVFVVCDACGARLLADKEFLWETIERLWKD